MVERKRLSLNFEEVDVFNPEKLGWGEEEFELKKSRALTYWQEAGLTIDSRGGRSGMIEVGSLAVGEELTERVINDLQTALANPLDRKYESVIADIRNWDLEANDWGRKTLSACVQIPSSDLLKLEEIEQLSLEFFILKAVDSFSKENDKEVAPGFYRRLLPGSPQNVLRHEREHVEMHPERTLETSLVTLAVINLLGFFKFQGNSSTGANEFTYEEVINICLEPRFLSFDDKIDARRFARESGDPLLVNWVESEIARKEKSLVDYF